MADIGGLFRGVGRFGVCVPSVSASVIARLFAGAAGVDGALDDALLGV